MTASFGDYQIIEQLQCKALGTVYLAEHAFLKKPYLLHMIPKDLVQEEGFAARFQEEIGKAAKLEHANILKTSNATELKDSYFIASEVPLDDHGQITDLSLYMKQNKGALHEQEVHRIACQLASAIDYAWEKEGIVHTAINLSSILLKKSGRDVEVLLTDFGLIKIFGPDEIYGKSFKVFLSQSAFLSPEQKEGKPADHKSDVYAFGALIYFLLMGKAPQGIFEMPSRQIPPS